jgi:hypothetical protein
MSVMVQVLSTIMLLPLWVGAFFYAKQSGDRIAPVLMILFGIIVICGIWDKK